MHIPADPGNSVSITIPHIGMADDFKQATGPKYGTDGAIEEATKRNNASAKDGKRGC